MEKRGEWEKKDKEKNTALRISSEIIAPTKTDGFK